MVATTCNSGVYDRRWTWRDTVEVRHVSARTLLLTRVARDAPPLTVTTKLASDIFNVRFIGMSFDFLRRLILFHIFHLLICVCSLHVCSNYDVVVSKLSTNVEIRGSSSSFINKINIKLTFVKLIVIISTFLCLQIVIFRKRLVCGVSDQ